MSKQYFELLEGADPQPGDHIVMAPTMSLKEHPRFVTFRPCDPEPANPWVKGSDRLPSEEDATPSGYVHVYRDSLEYPALFYFSSVNESDWWGPIDQTPPPADTEPEPVPDPETEAELVLDHLRRVISLVKATGISQAIPELRGLADDAEKQLDEIEKQDAWLRKVLFEWFDFFAMAESVPYSSEHVGFIAHTFNSGEETAAAFESFLKLVARVAALRESEGRDREA